MAEVIVPIGLPPANTIMGSLLRKLNNVRPDADGWVADCPSPDHDGQIVRLDVWTGEGGEPCARCDEGCEGDVLADVLFPPPPESRQRDYEEPGKPLRLKKQSTAELLAEQIPDTQWLVSPWLLESSLALIVAPPNLGKTLLAYWIAFQVAASGKRVLIIQEEGGKKGLQKRASRACAAIGGAGAHNIDWCYSPRLSLLARPDVLALCEECNGYALVIVDSLARVMPGLEENAAEEMGRVVAAMDLIKSASCAAVLGIHHTGKAKWKPGEVPSIGDGRGSGALAAGVDTILALAPVADVAEGFVEFDLHVTKQRDEEISKPHHVSIAMRGHAATVEVVEIDRQPGADKITVAMLAVIRAAGEAGLSKNKIEAALEGSNDRKRRCLDALIQCGQVEMVQHGRYPLFRAPVGSPDLAGRTPAISD